MIDLYLAWLSISLAFMLGGYALGLRAGTRKERDRCAALCEQTFREGRISGTVRRIYNAIVGDRAVVVPESEFFGE